MHVYAHPDTVVYYKIDYRGLPYVFGIIFGYIYRLNYYIMIHIDIVAEQLLF